MAFTKSDLPEIRRSVASSQANSKPLMTDLHAWRAARRASGGWPWISALNSGPIRSMASRASGVPFASSSSWK
jgi:hypothetical protein